VKSSGTVIALTIGLCAASGAASAQQTVRPYLWQAGMARSDVGEVNVFRRFPADRRAAMEAFYGSVLGLRPLPSSAPGGGQMIRYPVGASEVKLFPTETATPNSGAPGDAAGVRVLTLFYPDAAAVTKRFVDSGRKAPEFRADASHPGSMQAALVQDPAGHWVKVVIVPGASAEALARFEIGVAVSDIARSRAFYRDFMGFDELPAVTDPLLGATRHGYRHGSMTIALWAVDAARPKDTDTGGMQYIVWNVEAVNDVAQARAATIDRPLSAPGGMRTVWLLDPDGVSNYFAQSASNDNAPPAPQGERR
jgi:catechol 2,3-dioxygenase-like lactoylglutathione lyase family enzyme